jgi:phospholipase/lecithinase/hemolysin
MTGVASRRKSNMQALNHPTQIQTVIVFGDSLSDIGKKWKTNMGGIAQTAKLMTVSPTGRFSDCRNWTDFMHEEAGGKSLIVADAKGSYEKSMPYMSLTENSWAWGGMCQDPKNYRYANYAEGGACGDTVKLGLGTFEQQVDAFELDCKHFASLGNTLFHNMVRRQ